MSKCPSLLSKLFVLSVTIGLIELVKIDALGTEEEIIESRNSDI
jgi:hypothetical protein